MGKIKKLIYITGAYQVGMPLYAYGESYYNNYKREEDAGVSNVKRIQQTYNPTNDKWAIVTGASEGIGKCFAIDLAQSGFNIVLASRSQDKLEKVQKEIQDINPEVKVKVVPIDLAATTDYSVITSDKEVMSNLGIIVNNAGQLIPRKFFDQDPARIQSQHKLNLNAITLLTKYARNSFVDQNADHRYGLIQLASSISDFPIPQMTHYSATKRYDHVFAQMIEQKLEAKEKTRQIDQLIVQPGIVTTSMTQNANIPALSCLPEQCSRGSLNDLGFRKFTYGSMLHNLQRLQIMFTPGPLGHLQRLHIGGMQENIDEQMNRLSVGGGSGESFLQKMTKQFESLKEMLMGKK